MVVAPMDAGDQVFGAIGTFSSRRDAFSPAQIALVRALADHAAASMRNARLIEDLDQSRRAAGRTRRRGAVPPRDRGPDQRRHGSRRGPPARRRRGGQAAPRRRRPDRPDRPEIGPAPVGLRVGRDPSRRFDLAGRSGRDPRPGRLGPGRRPRAGRSGRATTPTTTGSRTARAPTRTSSTTQVRSALAAPLTGESGPFGALDRLHLATGRLGRGRRRPAGGDCRPGRDHDPDHAADRGARPIAAGARASGGRRAGPARDRGAHHGPAGAVGDPPGRGRAGGSPGRRRRRDPRPARSGDRQPALGARRRARPPFTAEERAKLWISVGVGATGVAVAEDRVVVADDDLAAQFPPSPESTRLLRAHRFPLDDRGADHRRLGAARGHRGVRDPAGGVHQRGCRLVGALASQAAIAITQRAADRRARTGPRPRSRVGRTPSGRSARSPPGSPPSASPT